MSETTDILRGELERLFDIDALHALSKELLGLEPGEVAPTDTAAAGFVRALVARCEREGALPALVDAASVRRPDAASELRALRLVSEPELPAGVEVDGWTVRKTLEEGPLGFVYLAERQGESGKERGRLRVLSARWVDRPGPVARWLVVQRALRQVDELAPARVLDVGRLEDGRPWVASRFVPGQTLAERIARLGPMHPNEARALLGSLFDAVEALERAGLVHGDIGLHNVLVTRVEEDGSTAVRAVLQDAGHYRLFESLAPPDARTPHLWSVFGAPLGLAPERWEGREPDVRSEQYAFGALLYELLGGVPPWDVEDARSSVWGKWRTSPPPPSERAPKGWVSAAIDEVVLRALAPDPADRFASWTELREAFESAGRSRASTRRSGGIEPERARERVAKLAERLRAEPGEEEVLSELERLGEEAGVWREVAEALREAIEACDESETRSALRYRLARILETELDDVEGAEAVYRALLDDDPEDELARAALEEALRVSGKTEQLVELLLEKAERAERAEERAATLHEIGMLYEQLGDTDGAFAAHAAALLDRPSDDSAQQAVERLAAEAPQSRWPEVLQSLAEAARDAETPLEERVHLLVLMGRWYGERLERPDFAVQCLGEALQLDPSCEAARDGLESIYRKGQSWKELAALLEQRAEREKNPARARERWTEAAEVAWRMLGDEARAEALLRRVLESDPGDRRAGRLFDALLTARERWQDLADALERRAEALAGEERAELLCRLAELYEDRLDEVERAAAFYDAALDVEPGHLPALKGLERIYARLERHEKLLENLRKQLERVATPRQRIAILERIGALLEEEFVDRRAAAEAFEQVVEIEPGHEAANKALARLYRKLQSFEDLVRTLTRHAQAEEDSDRKVELLLKAARVLAEEVGAPERAIELVKRAIAVIPKDPEALELLAQYEARAGDAQAAVEATVRLAEGEVDRKRRAELWVQAARMLEESGDRDGAIVKYKEALDAVPSHKEAAAALRRLFAERGDVQGAIELLEQEIEATDGPIRKADLYAELGAMLRDRLGDRDGALRAFERAAELDPTDTMAALGLGMLRYEREEWEEASRWLQVVASRWEKLERNVAIEAAEALADSLRRIGQPARAVEVLQAACERWPEHPGFLAALADVLVELERFEDAAERFEEFLERAGDRLVGAEKGRALARFGRALARAGRVERAREVLEQAAELLPEEPVALEALRRLHAEQGDWPGVVEVLRRMQRMAEPDRRVELLVEEGDVWLSKLGNRDEAAKRYTAALELREGDRNILTKLMAVYSEAKDWSRLVEVILRIAEFVEEPTALAKYYLTAASIAHRELKRHAEAAEYYERALEASPDATEAFEGLVAALTEAEDWETLCDAYRAQIERAKGRVEPAQRAAWWDALGETLRERLGRAAEAVEAYEEANQLDPSNQKRLQVLADIYATDPARYLRRAVQVQEQLLAASPYRVETYRRLGDLYRAVEHEDGRWCVAQTLSVLRQAGPEEKALYEAHRLREPIAARRFVTEDLWFQYLVHPSQDPLLTEIFALVLPAAAEAVLQSPEQAGVQPATRIDPDAGDVPMAGMLKYAAALLELPLPELHRRESEAGGLSFVWSRPPVIGLGRGALVEAPAQALAFVAARHLSYLRPGHLLRHLVPRGRGLRSWLLAAIELAQPNFPVPGAMRQEVADNRDVLARTLSEEDRSELTAVVHRLLTAAPELDLKRWIAAVDLTADRVGFLVAGDLQVATAVVKASPEGGGGPSSKERLKELYLYSVSDAYLRLREQLGIDVGG